MTKKSVKTASDEQFKQEPQGVIVSEVVEFEELTDDEEKERLRLERVVERSFVEAGRALARLRDLRLYRSTHKTFEEYVRDRFDFSRRRPYQLIDAAKVVDHLIEECEQFVHIWPTKEAQVRPLTYLNPSEQVEAWTQAVEQSGGKVPPARVVKSIVDQIRERTKVPNPWRVGEVASIIVKENPDLKGKGGCWAVITAVHDFSCTVRLWDGEYLVKPEHLKSFSYSMTDQDKNFFSSLGERVNKLSLNEVEKPVRDFLAGLGKIDRPWLTELEERVLRVLEGN